MNRFKPNASVKTRILLAALLWSLIGMMLMVRGFFGISGSGLEWLFPAAVLIGLVKSGLVLDRVAEKNMLRILEKGENQCLGGIYSWRTWMLVLAMILFGRLLRASSLPLWFIGVVYFTVGFSLFWSSRKVWSVLSGSSKSPLNS
ncbi:MAG: hypothetical protein KKG47_13990 [Proteobacteria bacterium]|nr:hypothetical protein [Pseudomonadota bacterium]MBU1737678.1 hypothetical protein [Pseudomonadota bacterium]